MNTVAEIQAKNAALLETAPANDNATDPWGHINRLQAEYNALMNSYDTAIVATKEMADTLEAMNASNKQLITQLIERGRPDFTPMEAEHA